MKLALSRALLFVVGLMLVGWAFMPARSRPVAAAPLMVITDTPSVEPNTPTSTTTNTPDTNPSPSATATATATATDAAATPDASATATATVEQTSTATVAPPPTDEPREERDPTATPTASPSALPATSTPTATPPPAAPADPAITKSVNPPSAQLGAVVEYTITVTNQGGSTATNVVAEDTLPSFLTIEGATASRGDVSVDGQRVRVVIGDLAPGETVTVRVSARVRAGAVPPNNANLATVSTDSDGDNPDNNRASVPLDVVVPQPARLPSTGAPERDVWAPLGALLGVALIAVSLFLRRKTAW